MMKWIGILIFISIMISSCLYETESDLNELNYVWSGAVTDSSAVIQFRIDPDHQLESIAIEGGDRELNFSKKDFEFNSITGLGQLTVPGLEASTDYQYRLTLSSDKSSTLEGAFRTFDSKPFSFSFAFGSCARTGSDHPVYETILETKPLFFMNIGDFHYGDVESNCNTEHEQALYKVLSSSRQARLYSQIPFVYMWDDHDYGGNDDDRSAPCKRAALDNFREMIPHYKMAFQEPSAPVSQAFEVGNVKFLLTDLRSAKKKPEYVGCTRVTQGSNFGSVEHLNWFKYELLEARRNKQLVIWVSGIPWINGPGGPNYDCDEDDNWGGFPEEREHIANFIKENDIKICILSGDAHMAAIDDGSNSDYATNGGAPIPVFHGAPLDRPGSYKGGPYSHGYSGKRGQFGWVDIEPRGSEGILISWTAYDYNRSIVTNKKGKPLKYQFAVDFSKEASSQ